MNGDFITFDFKMSLLPSSLFIITAQRNLTTWDLVGNAPSRDSPQGPTDQSLHFTKTHGWSRSSFNLERHWAKKKKKKADS